MFPPIGQKLGHIWQNSRGSGKFDEKWKSQWNDSPKLWKFISRVEGSKVIMTTIIN